KHVGMQNGFGTVDVFDEALYAPQKGKVFFLALSLVYQANLDAVVQEGKLTQALGQNIVVIFDVLENGLVGQKVNSCALFIGTARNMQRFNALALTKLHFMSLALAPDSKAQPLRQGVDARNTYAVQTTRHLVRVVVELAAGVQFGHDDFGGASAVLVVFVNVGRNTAPVVGYRDAVVGMNGYDDVVAVAGQGFIDGVVDHLENHVMKSGAIGGVADVHAWTLADRFKALEHLDGFGAVACFIGNRGLI